MRWNLLQTLAQSSHPYCHNPLGASVYRATWGNTVSRTITTVWRISVNTEQSVSTLSMAIPASAKRVSGEDDGDKSSARQITQTCTNALNSTHTHAAGPDWEEMQMVLHNQTLDCLDLLRACVCLCARVQQMKLHVVNYSVDCWQERNKFITRDGWRGRQREEVVGMQETKEKETERWNEARCCMGFKKGNLKKSPGLQRCKKIQGENKKIYRICLRYHAGYLFPVGISSSQLQPHFL